MTLFDAALALVLTEEGGKVSDPRDPGGRTNQGITQATYDAWQRAHGLLRRDVYTITATEVAAIYRNSYAATIRFDDLPAGVDYCVFDDAVNSGAVEGAKELQRAVGVPADGVLGAVTLAAVAKVAPVVLIGRLCDGRLTFLRRLKAFVTFGKGWSNRVAFVRSHALAMARAPALKVDLKVNTAAPATPAGTSIPVSLQNSAISQVPPCARPDCPLHVVNPVREMLR